MSNPSSARWRDGLRRRGFGQLVDQALEVAFGPEENDSFAAAELEETPRLARGICWKDLVAEMERDRLASESGHQQAA